MYSVYVIRSETNGKIYIGQTSDLETRLKQHNDRDFDKRSYTKLQGNRWSVVYEEKFNARSEALRREKELKSSRGRNFIKTVILAR